MNSRNYGTKLIEPLDFLPYITMALLFGFFLMIAAHVSSPLQEDDPGWNCFAHGNHICGAPELEPQAWNVWDESHKAETLGAQCTLEVEYVGVALLKPSPNEGLVTVSWEDGKRFVFRAECL